MKKVDYRKSIFDFVIVALGCILIAFAITSILKPNGLVSGGVTGITIILEKVLGINYTYINYFLSLLVLAIAWVVLGKKDALRIITLSVVFPLILIIFERLNFNFIENDRMLASVYFGIICGSGVGLIIKRGYSSGGTDTIAKILHHKLFPFMSIGGILLGIDGLIIAASALVYGKNVALYAIISQIIFMKAIDMVIFGLSSQKVKVEIVSDKHNELLEFILHTVKRGVSTNSIKGGYMNLDRIKITTICSPRESMILKRFIAQNDPDAFVNVLPVVSVWGKGVGFESLIEED
jgi:uncharacterized membrane-anchored protein YitT (DUF2179 family)